ncbi:folliculin isoform X2 [Zootermopsis nevadensis]|uniref:folliculin isoform X2 n=1 Tax=Zootermopsis nevadensis TaxID=136037 RepID=UPI000B8E2C4B|nr:folliculin isoform X2 [Zootermopsis nevadensis]
MGLVLLICMKVSTTKFIVIVCLYFTNVCISEERKDGFNSNPSALCVNTNVMNAVISLCHFCELHGPSVLFVTQAFHEPYDPSTEPGIQQPKTCYGNATGRRTTSSNTAISCEACQSLDPKQRFLCNDHEGRISYLSTQQATQHDVAALVRQACIRSLSCEVSPGKEGPVFFGDEVRGHVLSYTFFLKDAQARGFHRWFSVIILMRDKFFLLNSWPFLEENIQTLVSALQAKATEVYEREQTECPQRALRLTAAHSSSDGKHQQQYTSRSLAELTADKEVFPWLHLKFTWLLKAGADRLVEKIVEGLPMPDLALDLYSHQETEEGFTLVTAKQVHFPVVELEASGSHDANMVAPLIRNVRHLHQILGPVPFLSLAYCLMVGRQLILRGQPSGLIASIANSLNVLVPRPCYRAALNSDQYLDVSQCNILGVEPQIAVPQPSLDILRLDILQPDDHADHSDVNKYIYKITWGDKLPSKCPTILLTMQKAIENTKLNDSAMHYHFIALKEEWLGKDGMASAAMECRTTTGFDCFVASHGSSRT